MTIELPDGQRIERPSLPASRADRTWFPVAQASSLGATVTKLGDTAIGLCPTEDRCVPVPGQWHDVDAGLVDLTELADELDLVIVDDGQHAVIRRASAPGQASQLHPGDRFDLELPDLSGSVGRVASKRGQMAVFAWASW